MNYLMIDWQLTKCSLISKVDYQVVNKNHNFEEYLVHVEMTDDNVDTPPYVHYNINKKLKL
jgi:hypothetical protein